MDNSFTSNAFLFSFEGRTNRAKYWYALFASSAACLVFLSILAFAIGSIFGAGVKSVYVDFNDVLLNFPSFPFSVSFRDAASSPAAMVSVYVMGTPVFVVAMWFLAATTVKRLHDRNKSGWWMVPLAITRRLRGSVCSRIDLPPAALLFLAVRSARTAF